MPRLSLFTAVHSQLESHSFVSCKLATQKKQKTQKHAWYERLTNQFACFYQLIKHVTSLIGRRSFIHACYGLIDSLSTLRAEEAVSASFREL